MTEPCGPQGRISLIVCTIGRRTELAVLLESLLRQTYTRFEVIVVDSNPVGFLDPVLARFREKLTIRHVYCERGLSRARNLGLRTISGQFVGFPDDDCWYEADTLERVAALFRSHPHLEMITGRTVDPDGRSSVSPFLDVSAEITKLNVFNCANSASMFFKSEIADKVRSFDERLGLAATTPFQSGDESDFILRALAEGCRARYFPELRIIHPQVDAVISPREIARAKGYGAGFGATLRKHGYPKAYVAYRMARPAAGVLRALASLRPHVAQYRLAWLLAMWRGYRAWPRYDRIDIRQPAAEARQIAKLP